MGDYYSADRGRDDRADLMAGEARGQLTANPFGMLRVLEYQRALKVARAVKAGRELEMTFKQRARLLQDRKKVLVRLCDVCFR